MTPALEQIKALRGAVIALKQHLLLVDQSPQALAVAADADTALQALSDEAGEAVAEIVEAAERDGAFLSHCNVRLRVYNGYAPAVGDHLYTRPAPAAEAAPQGGVDALLTEAVEVGTLCNLAAEAVLEAGHEATADALSKGALTITRLAKALAATPPSAPAVDRDWYTDEAGVIHIDWDHDPARQLSLMLKPDGKVGWAICIGGEGCSGLDAMAPEFMDAIRRLTAPVPQEGVDEASEPDGYTAYGEFRWACDANERMRKEWTPLWTAALAAGALPQGGVALIAAERRRQIEGEGWTPEHDDEHDAGELALAAACYATPDGERVLNGIGVPVAWPWGAAWWKPTDGAGSEYWKPVADDRIRELVKAGALIAAEIDRLQRAAAPAQGVR